MPLTLTDESIYVQRSLERCRKQLADGFAEPLDAGQLRRIANIERIVATALQEDTPEQCRGLAEEVNKKAQPWIERKSQMMQWLKQKGSDTQAGKQVDGDDSNGDYDGDGSSGNDTSGEEEEEAAIADITGAPKDREDTRSLGLEGSVPRAIKREHSSLSGKRQELLGEIDGLRRRGVVPDTVEGVERLLKSQRSTQEDLTNDLVQMASILKKNTRAFGDVIERDKHVVDETAEALGNNLATLDKQGSRLTKYRKQAWGTTGITWLAVLVVVSVFFVLVLFMRIAPKRY